jgi:phage RecT family recombinase
MTVPATSRQMSPVESYTLQVIGDEQREADLWSALPEHVSPTRFKRNLVNLFMQKPEMLQYEPRLTFREVSKAAALGLLLDPQLGEAYIVPVWNNKAGRKEPELRCGYRGIIKLARQTREIANIYPGEVCENDHFLPDEGTEKRLEHRINYKKPRGRPYCYYAVVIYKDGSKDFDVMGMEALYLIRYRSDGWKAFKAGKIKSTPWATDEGEMCKKTVLRRLLKRVPQSPELSEALAMENAADFAPRADQPVRHLRPIETPRTINARLADFAAEDAPDNDTDFAAERSTAAAQTPAQGTVAGEPPASAAEPDAGGAPPEADPIAEARQAGREACRMGLPYDTVPKLYARYKNWAEAWRDGYQEEGERMEAGMNQ